MAERTNHRSIVGDLLADLYMRLVVAAGFRSATDQAISEMIQVFKEIGFLWSSTDGGDKLAKDFDWMDEDD